MTNEQETVPINPYFRLPLTFDPGTFYGPFEVVHSILETVSEAQTIAPIELCALPGMGKSTLLRYIAHLDGALKRQKHWLEQPYEDKPYKLFPVLVEFRLNQAQDAVSPFQYIYNRFTKEYEVYRARVLEEEKGVSLPDLARIEDDELDDPLYLLRKQSELLYLYDIRPILLLDDFDLPFASMKEIDTTRLRPLRDLIAFVMAVEQPLHRVNPQAASSPMFQSTPLRRLDGLSLEEARDLIREPAKKASKPFPKADVELVLHYTSGHPYLIILAGQVLWDMRKKNFLGQEAPLPPETHGVFLGHLARDFQASFRRYWNMLNARERDLLKKLSKTSDAPKNLDRIEQQYLSNLIDLGLVRYDSSDSSREFVIFSPLFSDFVEMRTDGAEDALQKNYLDAANGTFEETSDLTAVEKKLLDYLREHEDHVCRYEDLSKYVWNRTANDNDEDPIRRRMQVTVSRLRAKLKGEDIMSIRDKGYRLVTLE